MNFAHKEAFTLFCDFQSSADKYWKIYKLEPYQPIPLSITEITKSSLKNSSEH